MKKPKKDLSQMEDKDLEQLLQILIGYMFYENLKKMSYKLDQSEYELVVEIKKKAEETENGEKTKERGDETGEIQ